MRRGLLVRFEVWVGEGRVGRENYVVEVRAEWACII